MNTWKKRAVPGLVLAFVCGCVLLAAGLFGMGTTTPSHVHASGTSGRWYTHTTPPPTSTPAPTLPATIGYTVVQQTFTALQNNRQMTVLYPAGDVVLGGGAQVDPKSLQSGANGNAGAFINDSQPAAGNTGWQASFLVMQGYNFTDYGTLTVWAICAQVK